jgi:hypothetical protein
MPKYFFHIQRGDETIEDEEGIDLPNLDAVREGATEILSDEVQLVINTSSRRRC